MGGSLKRMLVEVGVAKIRALFLALPPKGETTPGSKHKLNLTPATM